MENHKLLKFSELIKNINNFKNMFGSDISIVSEFYHNFFNVSDKICYCQFDISTDDIIFEYVIGNINKFSLYLDINNDNFEVNTDNDIELSNLINFSIKTEEKTFYEFKFNIDNQKYWIQCSAETTNRNSVKKLILTIEDITNIKILEDRIKELEKNYSTILDTAISSIFIFDENFNIISANKTASNVFGYQEEEIKNIKYIDLFEDNYKSKANDILKTVVSNDIKYESFSECLTKNGKLLYTKINAHYIEISGKYLYCSRIIDISEQYLYKTKLEEELSNREIILELLPVGITIFNANGEIEYLNKKSADILSIDKNNSKGLKYNDKIWGITNFNDEPINDEENPFIQVLNSKSPIIGYEMAISRIEDIKKYLVLNLEPILSNNKEIIFVIVTLEDISEKY